MERRSARWGMALLISLPLWTAQALGADPVKRWYSFAGGSGVDGSISDDEATGIAVGSDGSVYLVGFSSRGDWEWGTDWVGKLEHGFNDGYDVLVAKLTPDGEAARYTFLGNSGDEAATGVALDGAGVLYVVGNSGSDWQLDQCLNNTGNGPGGFLLKLNPSTLQCDRRTFITDRDGKKMRVNAIAVDAAGSPYVAGKQDDRPCVAKLTADGTVVWRKQIGALVGEAFGIAVDPAPVIGADATVYVTGKLAFSASGGGSDSRAFVARKLAIAGDFAPPTDVGLADTVGWSIAVDAAGTAYVAGQGTMESFVKKVVWEGDIAHVDPKQWMLRDVLPESSDHDAARGIAVRSNGGAVDVYVVGDTSGTGSFGDVVAPWVGRIFLPIGDPNRESETEAWIVKLDSSLNLTWWTFMGSLAHDHGYAVALDGSGNVNAAGHSTRRWRAPEWGDPVIDHSPVPPRAPEGTWDLYAVRFDGDGDADAGCPAEDACEAPPCLAAWTRAWGRYVECVEDGLAKHYLGQPYLEHLNGCRCAYFAQWKPWMGDRFTHDALTVTDHLTGLVWEKKTNTVNTTAPNNTSDLHDVNNKFTWSAAPSLLETGTAFTTLVRAMNQEGFGNSNGWRLPTIAELQTLMNASGTGVLPEFPNVNAFNSYWSATSSPYGEGGCPQPGQCAWYVIFENDAVTLPPGEGSVGTNGKDAAHVRAVRGGR